MAVTNAAPAQSIGKQFWITEAAINNFKERGHPPDGLDSPEKLANHIDRLVTEGLGANQVEEIIDGEEEARLVRIENEPALFALVKKSNNPSTAAFAVVTVMTQGFADKKRSNGQWSKPNFSVGGLSAANKSKLLAVRPATQPTPPKTEEAAPPAATPKRGLYLILYRTKGDSSMHQVWANEDVETQMNNLNAVPGSIEVYKKMEIALRIMDS